MKFAYADPPYFGSSKQFYGKLHQDAAAYDRIETHAALIKMLGDEFRDGWAMSLNSPNLKHILPLCPPECRVMAWVKPFCSFKPGVAYAWEPVIFFGGRRRTRDQRTVRDFVSANIALKKGFCGSKPRDFTWWIMEILNVKKGDEVVDLFPGSGAVTEAIKSWPGHTYSEQIKIFEGEHP